MNYNKGFSDVEIDVDRLLIESGLIDEYFYISDVRDRKLYFNQDVSSDTVYGIVRNIFQYNADDKGIPVEERKPIILYLTSNGGDVDAGFELISVIKASKTPVYTVNLGYQYSMGFLIGLAGHKRFAVKTAKFLMHDGSSFAWDSSAKLQDRMEFQKKVDERIKDYVIENSSITSKEYDKKFRVEWYMFADEAKEKGVTDYIIGEDCDIDEII